MAVLALTRLGFGPAAATSPPSTRSAATDVARLTAWVDQQLKPAAIPDAACDAAARGDAASPPSARRLHAALPSITTSPTPSDWYERIRPATETELATWTRAVYSKRQLFEVMVDFWHNHFNVYAWEFIEAPVWVHHDRDVIRANALGNFRQMLEAVAKSPAMLVYLDNFINFAAELDGNPVGSNENFARETIELHCLGAERSYGNIAARAGSGRRPNPIGYCQHDVVDVARALTGWTFDIDWVLALPEGTTRRSLLLLRRAHDAAEDRSLGHDDAGRRHRRERRPRRCSTGSPRTPPAAVSSPASSAAAWSATSRRSRSSTRRRHCSPPYGRPPTRSAQVVRHIVLSNEFQSTWGEKVKRPFEIAVSALRAGGATSRSPLPRRRRGRGQRLSLALRGRRSGDLRLAPAERLSRRTRRLAERQPARRALAPGQLAHRGRTATATTASSTSSAHPTPPAARSANEIVDFWIAAHLRPRARRPPTATSCVDFMAAGPQPGPSSCRSTPTTGPTTPRTACARSSA